MTDSRTLLRMGLNPGFAAASVICHSGNEQIHYHVSLTVVRAFNESHCRWTVTPDLDEAETVFAALCHWLGMLLAENPEVYDTAVDNMSINPESSYVKCWELCQNL